VPKASKVLLDPRVNLDLPDLKDLKVTKVRPAKPAWTPKWAT
jgi:hypothetical protein